MNHAITIGGLLLGIGAFAGLFLTLFGWLLFMAAGNAPVPDDRMGKIGCAAFVAGAVMLALAIWGLLG